MKVPPLDRLLRLVLGSEGERLAARYLRRQGMRILARRFRVLRGEIDLVAREGDILVFVEVKTRQRGNPAEAVTLEKQRRVTRAALAFLRRYDLLDAALPCRFDIVAVRCEPGQRPVIEHLKGAFEAADL